MGKLGVGIGDDFPIDDGRPQDTAPPGPGSDYEREREEWRKRREEWREKRRQWRDEWRKKRREFQAEIQARYGDFHDDDHWRWHASPHHILRILAILGLIVVTIMIFSHIYILFGLIVLAGLYFAYRGGFDHFDYPHTGAPPRPNPPAPPADAPKA